MHLNAYFMHSHIPFSRARVCTSKNLLESFSHMELNT